MSEKKSSGIAAILSVILPGLGQIYVGEIALGIVFIILAGVFGVMSLFLIGLPLYFMLWVYAVYRAYDKAEETYKEPKGQEEQEGETEEEKEPEEGETEEEAVEEEEKTEQKQCNFSEYECPNKPGFNPMADQEHREICQLCLLKQILEKIE